MDNNKTETTAEDVLIWLGDGFTKKEPPINELAQVVADLVNGKYPIEDCKGDIANLAP